MSITKILITGATGFIGTHLLEEYLGSNVSYKIYILTRTPEKVKKQEFHPVSDLSQINDDINIIINLCGENISNKLWTKKQMQKIYDSRIVTTQNLLDFIAKQDKINKGTKQKLLISASAVGYYGINADNQLYNEKSPASEELSFPHKLCNDWEQLAKRSGHFNCEHIIMRLGVVLGKDGGILQKLTPIYKNTIGVCLGDGNNYMPMIHVDDVCRFIEEAISRNINEQNTSTNQNDNIQTKRSFRGVYNLVMPRMYRFIDLHKKLSKKYNKPNFVFIPSFLVKIIFGKMGQEILLSSQKVSSNKLLDEGFTFRYNNLDDII